MKIDNLEQYINVREALIKEKSELEARLSRIQQALGETAETASNQNLQRQRPASAEGGPRRGRPPVGGGQSLREVVASVLQNSPPLTKQEVLERVMRTGYKFTTKNPLNSLGVILYGKGHGFIRENGRFSVQGAPRPRGTNGVSPASTSNGTSASNGSESGASKGGRSGRKMSEEARARIAAAARARWKKAKSEGRSRL